MESNLQTFNTTNDNYHDTNFIDYESLVSILATTQQQTQQQKQQSTQQAQQPWWTTTLQSFPLFMKQLLASFANYHRQLVASHPMDTIQFEFSTVSSINQMQCYVRETRLGLAAENSNSNYNNGTVSVAGMQQQQQQVAAVNEEIHFLLPLENDYLHYLMKKTVAQKLGISNSPVVPLQMQQPPTLLVIYNVENRQRIINVSTQLLIPDYLKEVKEISSFRLPDWRSMGNTCVVEYYHQVNDKMNKSGKMEMQKTNFLNCCTEMFGQPLEYDELQYSKAVYLFMQDEFAFMVFVTIPETFPTQCPIVQLQSVQHVKLQQNNKFLPIRCRLQDYTYAPDWAMVKMVESIKGNILTVLPQFRQLCEK